VLLSVCDLSKAKGARGPRRRRPQLYVYDTCIQQYRARHRWMAFIDADEFFVLRDARAPDLPALLAEYEQFGALAVNWQARRTRAAPHVRTLRAGISVPPPHAMVCERPPMLTACRAAHPHRAPAPDKVRAARVQPRR
jgi:hypothetical protein